MNGVIFRYNALIIEALSVLKDPSGMDIGSICGYIEVRAFSLCPITSTLLLVLFDEHSRVYDCGQNKQEVPSNFRRLLSSKLRRLVAQDKIERVDN